MNRVTEILGVKYPIIQAPMGWIARSQLASAVSNAGGFGIIETSSGETENCKAEILAMSKLTDKPFGVNLPLMFLRDESMIELVLEQGIKFVTTSAGDPGKYIHILKDAGINVFHAVPSVAGAIKAADAGVDGLVIEGTEGGGFKSPEEVGLIVLIQAIRKHIDLPIIAAGGIASGRGMLAAMVLGADAVQLGSRFAATKESSAHQNFKTTIINAKDGDTHLTLKELAPVRLLKNKFYRELQELYLKNPSKEQLKQLLGRARAKKGMFEGDLEYGELEIGQISGLIDEIKPVKEVLDEIINEFNLVKSLIYSY